MKIRVTVGLAVFALALALQIYLLKPDATPQTLTGQVWLPSEQASSALLSQRNNQAQKLANTQVSLDTFKEKETKFTQSDVVLATAPGSAPVLNYFGMLQGGTFLSSDVSVSNFLPKRPTIYSNNWATLTFDRSTGQVSVESQVGWEGLVLSIFIVALVAGVSLGLGAPLKVKELTDWAFFLAASLGNVAVFLLWQYGKDGFAAEPAIFAFFAGLSAVWCYTVAWHFVKDSEESPVANLTMITMLTAIGVGVETSITTSLLGAPISWVDAAVLAVMYFAVAFIVCVITSVGAADANRGGES